MNNIGSIILEIIWIILGIICIFISINNIISKHYKQSLIFFSLAILSFLMYTLRRYIRKNQK